MADAAPERFSGLLLRFRGKTGLTQRELAARVGASRRVLQDWEAGVNVPGADRLQTLIAALFEAGGLAAGREAADARSLWTAALNESSSRLRRPLDEEWLERVLEPAAAADAVQPATHAGDARRQDWGEAPDIVGFVGRAGELATCRTWLIQHNCRLLTLLGMGGIGKTTFAARLAQDLVPDFQRVYWRSLRHAPPTSVWLAGAIGFVSDHQRVPPPSESERLAVLLQLLRERRSLLVLDNFETVLESAQLESGYRAESAGYGRVLQTIGGGRHQSCLVLTSREAPPELAGLGGGAVHTLELGGLDAADGQVLLAHNQLTGSSEQWTSLNARFGGNGLALKIVGERIRQLFGGHIGAFLKEESTSAMVFGGIRRLLGEQIERGSPVEHDLLRLLAVEREPVTLIQLLAALDPNVGRGAILDAVEGLRRRSLVERTESDGITAFTLQPVVLEYVTEELVDAVSDEIERGARAQLTARPLMKAHAKEYVRQTQERLIGAPVIQLLNTKLGEHGTEQRLIGLLEDWRGRPGPDQGYGPGNVVNLLRLFRGGDLRGIDLSRLSIRQAYLAGIEAQGASLAGVDLIDGVLAEAFRAPFVVALSGDGSLLAVGTATGEVWLFRVADRAALLVIHGHTSTVWGVALSPDGRVLASGSDDGTLRLWEVSSGRPVSELRGHTSAVYRLGFAADGRVLASGSADGTVRIWDVPSGRLVSTLHGPGGAVRGVAIASNGQLVAGGNDDGSVWLWDFPSGRLVSRLIGHTSAVFGVAMSADGRLLASGSVDGIVRLWEVPSGRALTELRGHTSVVWGVAMSEDGRLLASSSADGTVRLWDPPTGRSLAVLQGHTSLVLRSCKDLWRFVFLPGSERGLN